MTNYSSDSVYSSKRKFHYEGKGYRDSDSCCSQAIFHDKCSKCTKCDHCCKCHKEKFDHHCKCGKDHCDCRDEVHKPKPKPKHKPHNDYKDFFQSFGSDATISQEGSEYSLMDQESAEFIYVKESCNIKINTTNTQVGLSLQAALQLAISLVLSLTIADSNDSNAVSEDLIQQFNSLQTNKQKIYIYNTKDATVTTQDTDLAINVQAMLQVLLTLVVLIDIL